MSWYSSRARWPGRVWGTKVFSIPVAQRKFSGPGPGKRGFVNRFSAPAASESLRYKPDSTIIHSVNELTPFSSFWLAGFECTCHRRRDGRRLDLLEATGHDRFAIRDYARLPSLGITTARDGLRWHRIDRGNGSYDFSELLPRLA